MYYKVHIHIYIIKGYFSFGALERKTILKSCTQVHSRFGCLWLSRSKNKIGYVDCLTWFYFLSIHIEKQKSLVFELCAAL